MEYKNLKRKILRILNSKKYRQKNNKIIIEGQKLIKEAFASNLKFDYCVINENKKDKFDNIFIDKSVKLIYLKEELYLDLTNFENPEGILGIVNFKVLENLSCYNNYLIIDRIQDPGNLGTLLRIADAAGIESVICLKGTVDTTNFKVIRSSMGSLFHLKLYQDITKQDCINFCKKNKIFTFGACLDGVDYRNIDIPIKNQKFALLVGNEGKGVDDFFEDKLDLKVNIPIRGNAESLNVASACAVIVYKIFEKIEQEG